MRRLYGFLACLLFLHAGSAFASWTKGTCANFRMSSTGTCSSCLSITATSGQLVVFMIDKIGAASNSISTGPTDSNGTLSAALAYTEVNANSEFNGVGFYYILSATAGTHAFSVTFASSGNFMLFACPYTYTGTANLDVTGAAINTGSGVTASSGSLTPTQSGDLVIATLESTQSTSFGSWTNSFVQEDIASATSPRAAWADLNPDPGTTSISTSATVTSGAWAGYIVAFKSGSGSTACPCQMLLGN